MRLIAFFLTLTLALLAKDNFIYTSYKPGEVEGKLAKLEKEIAFLKKDLSIVKRQQAVKTKTAIETKTKTILLDKKTKESVKDLKVMVWNLKHEMKKLAHKADVKPQVVDNGNILLANKELAKKIAKLESRINSLPYRQPEKIVTTESHESMRIDILDEKIRNVERALSVMGSRPTTNEASSASTVYVGKVGLDFEDKVTQYFLLVVGSVFILLFAMAAMALSRSKDALYTVRKLASVTKRS